ncbi:TPA: hypothetical protein ACKJ3R_002198, partial [Neisseria gonorrhoeae]
DYEDKEDSLFPLFIPEIELYKYQFYSEIIIDVGIIIKISAETINFEPLGKIVTAFPAAVATVFLPDGVKIQLLHLCAADSTRY